VLLSDNHEVLKIRKDAENKIWLRGRVHKIVVTGGPCGGKSTILSDLTQMLEERHYMVCAMPEVATMMYHWSGGRMWEDYQEEENAKLQLLMTKLQMDIEDAVVQMGTQSLVMRRHLENPPKGVVILFDRGVVDNKAYCSEQVWADVTCELGTTTSRLRDGRYDAVVHLVTAANGAEKFYTLDQAEGAGSSARHETAEEARKLDKDLMRVWHGARELHIVPNQGSSFPEKRHKVEELVLSAVGEKVPRNSERVACKHMPAHSMKEQAATDPNVSNSATIQLHMTNLMTGVRLLKRKTADDAYTYYVQALDGNEALGLQGLASQYQIDSWTYNQKVVQARTAATVESEQSRESVMFTYKDQYCRCHVIEDAAVGGKLILVEVHGTSQQVDLPSWLEPLPNVPKTAACMTMKF